MGPIMGNTMYYRHMIIRYQLIFLSKMKLIPHRLNLADLDHCYLEVICSIQSLPRFGTALAAPTETELYP